jgi:hypothetical protein
MRLASYAAIREGSSILLRRQDQMSLRLPSRRTAVALAAVALPLPLHAVHRSARHDHPAAAERRLAVRAVRRHRKVPHRPHVVNWGLTILHARSARDPGETISDYKYTPATLTVHLGDTVTWTNNGPTEHTATANDGSFDTGLLQKGAGASHTFTHAGTFTYFCKIHPFMHGTIIVLAAAVTPAQPASSTTATTSTTATNTGPSLPNTGLDLGAIALSGVLFAGAGYLLRRTYVRN